MWAGCPHKGKASHRVNKMRGKLRIHKECLEARGEARERAKLEAAQPAAALDDAMHDDDDPPVHAGQNTRTHEHTRREKSSSARG